MAYENLAGGQSDSFVVESASTAPVAGRGAGERSWLDEEHAHYKRMLPRWQMVKDFYLGDVADETTARTYLVRRFQGEPQQAFEERVKTVDFTPHLGTVLDALAGMFFAVEDRTSRVWSKEDANKVVTGLGDPEKPGTPAHRLWRNADGKTTGWSTLWRRFTLDLICYQDMWVLVDTLDDDTHVVKLITPDRVPNWIDGPNGVIEVLMKEDVDARKSLTAPPMSEEKTFIRWTVDGWERWQKTKDGPPNMLGSGPYTYKSMNDTPSLPIFRVRLPISRYVAWLLAKKAAVLFNMESVRDFGLRIAGFSKLMLGVQTDEQFDGLVQKLAAGENVLPVVKDATPHAYISPPSEPTINTTSVLDKKIEMFWVSAFQMYSDAAQEKTATEVKQNVAAGVGAFLQLLKSAVDDAENGAFFRLEQAEFSESKGKWGVARVERTDDFSTVDLGAVLDQMRKRYIGETGTIPIGRSAKIQLAKDAARQDGLPVNDDEIALAVDAMELKESIEQLQLLGVTPAIIKARLTMKLVSTMGLIDPEETVEMMNGEKENLFEVLMNEAEKLAMQQEEAQRRMVEQPFGGDPNAAPKDGEDPPPDDPSATEGAPPAKAKAPPFGGKKKAPPFTKKE